MLQIGLALQKIKIAFYVTGERKASKQIKMRAERLKPNSKSENFLSSPKRTQKIFSQQLKSLNPEMIVIDSIQTL